MSWYTKDINTERKYQQWPTNSLHKGASTSGRKAKSVNYPALSGQGSRAMALESCSASFQSTALFYVLFRSNPSYSSLPPLPTASLWGPQTATNGALCSNSLLVWTRLQLLPWRSSSPRAHGASAVPTQEDFRGGGYKYGVQRCHRGIVGERLARRRIPA